MAQDAKQADVPKNAGLNWGRLESGVGTMVRVLRNELTTRIVNAYAPFDLRSGALTTMVLIDANPGCSQSQLANEVAMDDSAMVAIIDDLEARGLAQRSRSPVDRRRNTLKLTPEGEQTMMDMLECAMRVEKPIRDALSKDELKTLVSLLKRSYAALLASPE